MKINVSIEAEIEVEFDETSEEFKELFDGYKESIDSDADYTSFAESVANMAARYGTDEFIEGVGYPRVNGEKHKTYLPQFEEHDCPVNLICEDDVNGKIQFDACGEIVEAAMVCEKCGEDLDKCDGCGEVYCPNCDEGNGTDTAGNGLCSGCITAVKAEWARETENGTKVCGTCSHFSDEDANGYGACYLDEDDPRCNGYCDKWTAKLGRV